MGIEALGRYEWQHIVARLFEDDRAAACAAFPEAAAGLALLEREGVQVAMLATFSQLGLVAVAKPTERGYTINTLQARPTVEVPRRLFVHRYASAVSDLLPGPAVVRSVIVHDARVASVLFGVQQPETAVLVPTRTRFHTHVHGADTRTAVLQHARGYVATRLGAPRSRAARRARWWTKVPVTEQFAWP